MGILSGSSLLAMAMAQVSATSLFIRSHSIRTISSSSSGTISSTGVDVILMVPPWKLRYENPKIKNDSPLTISNDYAFLVKDFKESEADRGRPKRVRN